MIDDARSHLSLLKMLRQFQYFDQNGKDQGANVRNRSKELTDLLGDVDKIRSERKKARSNRTKFGGVEGGSSFGGGGGIGGGSGSGSRYGGFGSEDASYGAYNGGVYGDGGGFGGQESSTGASGGRRDRFEEYDEGDDGPAKSTTSRHIRNTSNLSAGKKKVEESKKKEPEVDLFEFGDDPTPAATPRSAGVRSNATDDDEFDDFISATPEPTFSTAATSVSSIIPPLPTTNTISSSTTFAAPTPYNASQASNLSSLAGFSSLSTTPSLRSTTPASMNAYGAASSQQYSQPLQPIQSQPPKPAGYQAAQPNYFTTVQAQAPPQSSSTMGAGGLGISSNNSSTGNKPAAAKTTNGADAFSSLWTSASTSAGIAKKAPVQGPNLASLAKEKTTAEMWGAAAKPSQTVSSTMPSMQQRSQQPSKRANQSSSGDLDDLLG